MRLRYLFIILITISACKNNGNFDKAPSDWKTFEKNNNSALIKGSFKFKYPNDLEIDEKEGTNKLPEFIVIYPTENLKMPSITLKMAFLFNTKSSLDEFVDMVLMPSLKLTNKKRLILNGYNSYVFDIASSDNNTITKMYVIGSGERILNFTYSSYNKDTYEKTYKIVDTILDTIIIE